VTRYVIDVPDDVDFGYTAEARFYSMLERLLDTNRNGICVSAEFEMGIMKVRGYFGKPSIDDEIVYISFPPLVQNCDLIDEMYSRNETIWKTLEVATGRKLT